MMTPTTYNFDLGTFGREIRTSNQEAQIWFSRGLVWSYGFNHQASAECFENAIQSDPKCAMAYWGLAYALGPNYNKQWRVFDKIELEKTVERCRRALERAEMMASKHGNEGSSIEKALIHALKFRFGYYESQGQRGWQQKTSELSEGNQSEPNQTEDYHGIKDYHRWNQAYADAMSPVYHAYPDDLDVATLCADAFMNLTPWKLWDITTGQPARGARTLEVKAIIERSLTLPAVDKSTEPVAGRDHPGLIHLYIHLMEMSNTPELAVNAADRLRGLVPDAGHLEHMPSHLDILIGDYRRAIASNSDAIRADEKYVADYGAINFYALYRAHDYHFRIYAAMFAGISSVALETVTQLEKTLSEELLRVKSPPMADWLESFRAIRVHILVRFGRWQDLINLPFPEDKELYCMTTAMIHYGRGIAFSATGRIDEAQAENQAFSDAKKRVPKSRTLFNNTCEDILAIAQAMLDGELAYRRAFYDHAFEHLRKAIELDDHLPYDEPWGWMQPTRHAYGALLLEQGHVEEALEAYSADLGMVDTLPRARQHPNNVWALHGLHECLTRLGKEGEARMIRPQLRLAAAVADVPIKASCFCRLAAQSKRPANKERQGCCVS